MVLNVEDEDDDDDNDNDGINDVDAVASLFLDVDAIAVLEDILLNVVIDVLFDVVPYPYPLREKKSHWQIVRISYLCFFFIFFFS